MPYKVKMKLKLNWQAIKTKLIEHLKGAAVKAALKKILGSAAMGGVKGWIVKFIVTELYEEIAEPVLKYGLNKIGYAYTKLEGKVIVKRLEEARENNDADAYDSAADDVFDLRR